MANELLPDENANKKLIVSIDPSVRQTSVSIDPSVLHPSISPSYLHQQNNYHQVPPQQYYNNHPILHSGGPFVSQSQQIQQSARHQFYHPNYILRCPSILNGNNNHIFQGHSGSHLTCLSSNSFHTPPYYPMVSLGQHYNPIHLNSHFSTSNPIVRQYHDHNHLSNTSNVPNQVNSFGILADDNTNCHKEQRVEAKSLVLDPDGILFTGSFHPILMTSDSNLHWLFLYKLKCQESESENESDLSETERATIKKANVFMGAAIKKSKTTRAMKKPHIIKICETVCKGYNRSTCYLQYLWVRGSGEIGCYVRTPSNIISPTSLRHTENCTQSCHNRSNIVEHDFHKARKLGMASDSKYMSIGKSIVNSSNDPHHRSRTFAQKEIEKINDFCSKSKTKLKHLNAIIEGNGDKFDNESMKTIRKYLDQNAMTVDDFVGNESRYATMSTKELRQIISPHNLIPNYSSRRITRDNAARAK